MASKTEPQRLKPCFFAALPARLKPCPDKASEISRCCAPRDDGVGEGVFNDIADENSRVATNYAYNTRSQSPSSVICKNGGSMTRMQKMLAPVALTLLISLAALAVPQSPQTIASKNAKVDGLTLHYLTAGQGPAVVLIHGYTQTSRMWRPIIPQLVEKGDTVIAPDLPGIGDSDIPAQGLDMKNAAIRIHALVKSLGINKARVVGHDIGLMVAYAYAAQFPDETEKLVLMDAFLPGVAGWEDVYNNPHIWHFRFNGPTPEALVQGRESIYFNYFWNDLAADGSHSVPEADRAAYIAAYSRPGRMHAGWQYFISFQQTAKDFAVLAQTKLNMPVLTIGGSKANGEVLGQQAKIVAKNPTAVVLQNCGHWVLEEKPRETTEALLSFL
jgi:pimeloyl-ACP methyl ester carboxylesterase